MKRWLRRDFLRITMKAAWRQPAHNGGALTPRRDIYL